MNILLADDDMDDCSFFREAAEEQLLPGALTTVHEGEILMRHLKNEANELPDIIFLDINMPRKNGFECLIEIKSDDRLKHLPVIMFSTSFELSVVNHLYEDGAQYFIRKPAGFAEFKQIIQQSLALIVQENKSQPARKDFVITAQNSLIV